MCWNSVVMTSTDWAPAITTKSTQAADYPLLLTAPRHLSLIPLPATLNPQTSLELRPPPDHFSWLRESTFYLQVGRFAPRRSVHNMICPECYMICPECCVAAPVTPTTARVAGLASALATSCFMHAHIHTLPIGTALWRPKSVGNLWNTTTQQLFYC